MQPWIDAGLFDPAHADADLHRSHIEWLIEHGYSADDLAFAAGPTDVLAAANRRLYRPGRRYTFDEAQHKSGLERETFTEIARASGFPLGDDAVLYTDEDLASFATFSAAVGFFSHDELLHFARVISSSMSRIASAATALFRVDVGAKLEASGGDEIAWAEKNLGAAQLIDPLEQVLNSMFRLQLGLAGRRADIAREAVADRSPGALRLAIGFVDLVGFTALADSLDLAALDGFVRDFERQAYEVVAGNGGAVVKLIGDEVMFIDADPAAAAQSAIALIESFTKTSATPRAGLAYGDVVARGGDYYGSIVNLAARAVDEAAPGELLTDQATVRACESLRFESVGMRDLKGFAEPIELFGHRPT